jgi:hypothetical protein
MRSMIDDGKELSLLWEKLEIVRIKISYSLIHFI